MDNLILLTDSYKTTHWKQYPIGTTKVYSYLESRGGLFDNTVFYGLQYLIKKYLIGKVVTKDKIDQAKLIIDSHMGSGFFNESDWLYILEKYDGHLPIKIKAVPEGTVLKTKNVLLTIENTDPRLYWLTNYIESILLQIWYPITVSTLSREIKLKLKSYLLKTSSLSKNGLQSVLDFMLHDFGFRGVSSVESSSIGGSAHMVNFKGTDTIPAILFTQKYYGVDNVLAFSIPASEHSTITSWSESLEVNAMENMLDSYPTGLVACVSDSFDIIRACRDYWGDKLKDKILSRDGRLVIRPDSGDPKQTLKQVFNILWDRFGGSINNKGFKVLDDHIRVIQGDGVNLNSIIEICEMMISEGFSIENIAFGMGGALLQKVDRDVQNFEIKCSSITVNNKDISIFKNPIEINDKGERVKSFKASKKGNLKLVKDDYQGSFFKTMTSEDEGFEEAIDELVLVFENGQLYNEVKFEDVQERARVLCD